MRGNIMQRSFVQKKGVLIFLAALFVVGAIFTFNQQQTAHKLISLEKSILASEVDTEDLKLLAKKNGNVGSIKQSAEKIVYLTFDDSPSEVTEDVLAVLKKEDVKATFFVTGLNPDYLHLLTTIDEQGHTIGLHTYSHDYSKLYRSKKAYYTDLHKIEKVVEDELGYLPHYIRFPGGASNTVSRTYSKNLMTKLTKEINDKGYQYYDWNVDCGDAAGINVKVKTIVSNATNAKDDNIVLLMHDASGKQTTAKALPEIIKHYKKRGYEFRGIDDDAFVAHHPVFN